MCGCNSITVSRNRLREDWVRLELWMRKETIVPFLAPPNPTTPTQAPPKSVLPPPWSFWMKRVRWCGRRREARNVTPYSLAIFPSVLDSLSSSSCISRISTRCICWRLGLAAIASAGILRISSFIITVSSLELYFSESSLIISMCRC